MTAPRLAHAFRSAATNVALRSGERDFTYDELYGQALHRSALLAQFAGETIGIAGRDLPHRIVSLLAAELAGITPCLLPADMSPAQIDQHTQHLGLAAILDSHSTTGEVITPRSPRNPSAQPNGAVPAIWLFTSGTTGPPQPVLHTWADITATVHHGTRYQSRRWLLAYDAFSFAGLQVTLQALLTGGTLSDVSQATPTVAATRLVEEQVEFASGTPTFWRMLLGAVAPAHWLQARLEQITTGGEAISDGTLAALKAAFPTARISHIYATSELGVCFSVSDGLAGFPASYLQQPHASCQLRISTEGELEVLSRCAARAANESAQPPTNTTAAWKPTGDLVEVRAGRVYFVGRKSGTIHVGGGKVVPEEVEAVIRMLPEVVEVRVSAQASSVLGSIVRADVVTTPGQDPSAVRASILAACKSNLPRYKVPAMIEFHAELPRTASGKLARSGS